MTTLGSAAARAILDAVGGPATVAAAAKAWAKRGSDAATFNRCPNDISFQDLYRYVPQNPHEESPSYFIGSLRGCYFSRITNFTGNDIRGSDIENAVFILAGLEDGNAGLKFGAPVREYVEKYHTSLGNMPKNPDKAIFSLEEGFRKLTEFQVKPLTRENHEEALLALRIIEQSFVLLNYLKFLHRDAPADCSLERLNSLAKIIVASSPYLIQLAKAAFLMEHGNEGAALETMGIKTSREAIADLDFPDMDTTGAAGSAAASASEAALREQVAALQAQLAEMRAAARDRETGSEEEVVVDNPSVGAGAGAAGAAAAASAASSPAAKPPAPSPEMSAASAATASVAAGAAGAAVGASGSVGKGGKKGDSRGGK